MPITKKRYYRKDKTYKTKDAFARDFNNNYTKDPSISSTLSFLEGNFLKEYYSLIVNPIKYYTWNFDFIPHDEHIKLGRSFIPNRKSKVHKRKLGALNFYKRQHGYKSYKILCEKVKEQLEPEDIKGLFYLALWETISTYKPQSDKLYFYFAKRFRWYFIHHVRKELVNLNSIQVTSQQEILTTPPYDKYIWYSQLPNWEKYIIYSSVIQQESIKNLAKSTSFSIGKAFKEVAEIVQEE